jgi:hypothetical protein
MLDNQLNEASSWNEKLLKAEVIEMHELGVDVASSALSLAGLPACCTFRRRASPIPTTRRRRRRRPRPAAMCGCSAAHRLTCGD